MRPLSPAGQRASERLAESLADLGIEAIYSSPYRRAVETVTPLAAIPDEPIQELSDLRERAFGSFESGSSSKALQRPGPTSTSSIREESRTGPLSDAHEP